MTRINIVILLLFLLCSCNNNKADYIFPDDSNGWACVIFDHQSGEKLKTKDGRLQVAIPPSGILITRSKFPEGFQDNRFFKTLKNGSLVEFSDCSNSIKCNNCDTTLCTSVFLSMAFNFNKEANNIPSSNRNEQVSFKNVLILKANKKLTAPNTIEDTDKWLDVVKEFLIKNKVPGNAN